MRFLIDGGAGSVTFLSTTGLLTIYDCFFENNESDLGGALVLRTGGTMILQKNTFIRNKASFLNFIGSCSAVCFIGSKHLHLIFKNIYYLNSAENKGFK